jgi:hypothetical protein
VSELEAKRFEQACECDLLENIKVVCAALSIRDGLDSDYYESVANRAGEDFIKAYRRLHELDTRLAADAQATSGLIELAKAEDRKSVEGR